MDILRLYNDLELKEEDIVNYINRRRRPRIIRERPDHFIIWDGVDFHKRFRISKNSAGRILDQISNRISHTTNWNAGSTAEKEGCIIANLESRAAICSTGCWLGHHSDNTSQWLGVFPCSSQGPSRPVVLSYYIIQEQRSITNG